MKHFCGFGSFLGGAISLNCIVTYPRVKRIFFDEALCLVKTSLCEWPYLAKLFFKTSFQKQAQQ